MLTQMFYGEPVIRRAVPLALGLLSASNPQLTILDTLSRYSHDNDLDVAMNAIFAMGLVGAGSNQAKLAQMLRQLAVYYQKEADCLFVVRIAQGLVHMGKGLVTVNPAHTDRFLMSPTAIAGLLSTIIAFTDARNRACGFRGLTEIHELRSHSREDALDALLPHHGDVPPLPGHLRRGRRAITGVRPCGHGCRRGRPSGQAKDDLRFRNAPDASADGAH
jgi:hypothetical protein